MPEQCKGIVFCHPRTLLCTPPPGPGHQATKPKTLRHPTTSNSERKTLGCFTEARSRTCKPQSGMILDHVERQKKHQSKLSQSNRSALLCSQKCSITLNRLHMSGQRPKGTSLSAFCFSLSERDGSFTCCQVETCSMNYFRSRKTCLIMLVCCDLP